MKKILLAVALFCATFSLKAQWVAQPSNITAGFDEEFIDAVDPNVCWALVGDPTTQTNPVQEFTRTIDGGVNWVDGFINNATGLCPSSISAINADTAWVAMFEPTGGQGEILRTNDGGATWTWQTTALFSAAGNFPDFVHFWDANSGVCLGDPPTADGYFEIYTTSDGGTTWVRTPSGNIAPILSGEFGITSVYTVQGDSNIWFGTNKGRIYRSTDRGLNWTAATTPYTGFMGAIAFRDSLHGLCVPGGAPGNSDVARTTDGGLTWNLIGTNASGMTLFQGIVYLPGSDSTYFISTPYAGTVDGTTYSLNDGNSWNLVDNLIHTAIDFVNDSTGWTGSNELNAPMYKWSTPIIVPAFDALSQSIDLPANTGLTTQSPKATVKNNGLNTVTFDVTMTISGGYTSTKTVTNLISFGTAQVTFDPWTPAATGAYTDSVYTSLSGDLNNLNDTLIKTVTVYNTFANYGWVSKPNVGTGTFGLAGAFHLDALTSSSNGTLYSIGGEAATGIPQPTNNAFGTVANSWGSAAPMPSRKFQFSAQRAGGKIICAGGYDSAFTVSPSTYIYDIASNTWSTGAPMSVPAGDYASGVYHDSLIYYVGGFNGSIDLNAVRVYHVATNTWTTATAKPGTASSGLRGSINGNTIVVVGGFSQTLGANIAEAHKGVINPANPALITWTSLPAYPGGIVSRLAAGTVFMDFQPLIIFAGGNPVGTTANTALGDCWAYDLVQNGWFIGTPKTTPVSNISDLVGLIYNDSLWMASVGGYDGTNISNVHEWLSLGPFIWSGINENQLMSNNSIVVYPNPANSQLTLHLNSNNNSELTITDVSGRIVRKENVAKGQAVLHINISAFDAGIYFITATSEDGTRINSKFVKE